MFPRELSKAIFEGRPIDVFCIGTPDIVGDSVGPLIGTLLQRRVYEANVSVIGTLRYPIVRSNYDERLKLLRPSAYVIAIDAALGYSVGSYSTDIGPISPGAGTADALPPVGHMYIKCYTASAINGLFTEDERIVHHIAYKVVKGLADLFKIQKKSIYIDI